MMRVPYSASLYRATTLLMIAAQLAISGCADSTAPRVDGARAVSVAISANVTGVAVAGLTVEVLGPGIGAPAPAANLAIANGIASGRISVPAGSDRVFTVRAFDAKAIETHRGSRTADVRPGQGNAVVSVVLLPLAGGVPIEATIGTLAIVVSPPTASIAVGGTQQLAAVVTGADGLPIASPTLVWGASNPAIATVDASGLVAAHVAGSTTVVVSYQGLAAAAAITVTGTPLPAPVARVDVAPASHSLDVGQTVQLTATTFDAADNVLSGRVVTWQSSNDAIATVDANGLVTGVALGGPVTITATSEGVAGSSAVTVVIPYVALTFGTTHACALAIGGTIHCWGANTRGQLGNGSTASAVSTPVTVSAPAGVSFTAVDAGEGFSCALTSSSDIYCWGDGSDGQLGDGARTSRTSAVSKVSGGHAFSAVSAGGMHACGLTASGTIYCWGINSQSQLGDGSTVVIRLSPVLVQGGALRFKAVSAGDTHTCAIAVDDSAYCWGAVGTGQLGIGSTTAVYANTPQQVVGGLTWQAIAAGQAHTCGIATGGVPYCWGANGNGAVGDGTSGNHRNVPTAVSGGLSVSRIDAALHSCGVTNGGELYCWGSNSKGQFGTGSQSTVNSTPVRATPPNAALRFRQAALGLETSCALTTAGEVHCAGVGSAGQLGHGSTPLLSTSLVKALLP